ncbi:MAG: rhodanese-like domain-containing protein [Nitrospirota bacterium]|nr:rhodanese-like domain-containing protein [Nitrospirota bacterium]
MKGLRLAVLMVVGLLLFLPIVVFAEDDEGVGEHVREMAQNALKPNMPLGHYGIVAKYADQFLSTPPGGSRTLYAASLMDGINDFEKADELSDFFILDIRSEADFCKGHIAGAVNVPFANVAKPESLVLLPLDRPILVVCYTGHTASQTNAILNMLGYDAWTLRFGMTSWNAATSTKVWSSGVSQTIYGGGYPVEKCQ